MNEEKINLKNLRGKLAHLPLGLIEYYESIGSTNDRAAVLAAENAPNFSIVLADEQTEGRGRSGRSWFTPPGVALAFSIILRPQANIENSQIALVSGLGALAVAKGIKSSVGLDAKIKWPNDVLIDGEKVSGVLAEAHWIGEDLQSLILGIGVNISKNAVPPENELNFPATYLSHGSGKLIDRLVVLEAILQHIVKIWPMVGDSSFIKDWESLLEFKGKQVQLISGKEIAITGEIRGLADDGSLILMLEDNIEKQFKVGEIHLRPNIDKVMN